MIIQCLNCVERLFALITNMLVIFFFIVMFLLVIKKNILIRKKVFDKKYTNMWSFRDNFDVINPMPFNFERKITMWTISRFNSVNSFLIFMLFILMNY